MIQWRKGLTLKTDLQLSRRYLIYLLQLEGLLHLSYSFKFSATHTFKVVISLARVLNIICI